MKQEDKDFLQEMREEVKEMKDDIEREEKAFKDYIKEKRDKMVELDNKRHRFEQEHLIVQGSTVKVREGKKNWFKKELMPFNFYAEVTKLGRGEEEDKVWVWDRLNNQEYETVLDNVEKIDYKEYFEEVFGPAFEKRGRAIGEYRDGDVVLSKYIQEVFVVRNRRGNWEDRDQLLRKLHENVGNDLGGRYDVFPLYFVEDMEKLGLPNKNDWNSIRNKG